MTRQEAIQILHDEYQDDLYIESMYLSEYEEHIAEIIAEAEAEERGKLND